MCACLIRKTCICLLLCVSACALSCGRRGEPEEITQAEDDAPADTRSGDNDPDYDIVPRYTNVTIAGFREVFAQRKEHLRDLPITVGMPLSAVERVISEGEAARSIGDYQPIFILKKNVSEGCGYCSLFFTGTTTFWCDVVVKDGRVSSIWIMEGGFEIFTGVFFRLAGQGSHDGMFASGQERRP